MNNSQAKLLYIGSENLHRFVPLLLAIHDRGYAISVAGSEEDTVFGSHGIPYSRYRLDRWVNPLHDLRTLRDLRDIISSSQPDLVHSHDPKPAIFAPLVARRAGVPGVVRTINGLGYIHASSTPLARVLRPVYRSLQRRASHAADITVFQNTDDRDYFLRHRMVAEERSGLVRSSGFDAKRFRETADAAALERLRDSLVLKGQSIVILIARLVRPKGVLEYLEAARMVRAVHPDTTFLLVGPPASASEDRQAVSMEEVERYAGDVLYLGARDDVPQLLALSDIFAFPSYQEGFPRVLLEAAAMRLPIVATDVPGCREVVRDGWNGRLVAARSSQSLADGILDLMRRRDEWAQMGQRGRDYVLENFTLEKVADAHVRNYQRILVREPTRSRALIR